MKKSIVLMLVFAFIILPFTSLHAKENILRLATTTSTYETGLLDVIFKPFEAKYNTKVHIISVGTGKAIKHGENGDVDIVLVHARELEDKFVADGYGVNRRDVMYNDFLIIGPAKDPAKIKGLTPKEAMKRLWETKSLFVSRGDNSGTHVKELSLWKMNGLQPNKKDNPWYFEAGQGMNQTLKMADEKNAYVMIDRASFNFAEKNTRLKIMVEGGKELLNPYGVIAVSPYKYPESNYELAMAMIWWLTSPECQKMIEDYKVGGKSLYFKNAVPLQ